METATTDGLHRRGWRLEPLLDDLDSPSTLWLASRDGAWTSADEAFAAAREATALDGVVAAEPDLPTPAPGAAVPAARDRAGDRASAGAGDRASAHAVTEGDRDWPQRMLELPRAHAVPPAPGGHALGEGVRVGHPDTGYTLHPDLGTEQWDLGSAWDLIGRDPDPVDPLVSLGQLLHPSHGTSTGALIAGKHPAAPAGAAPAARIVPFRSVYSVVQVLDSTVARAVEQARLAGCDVLSISLGGVGFIGLRAAIRRAVADGTIVVAAAGNNVSWVCPPAVYPEVIAVAGVDSAGRPWSGSGRGPTVSVAGPAADVTTVGWDIERRAPIVGTWSGTSFATALVAGVAALWCAHHGPRYLRERYGALLPLAFRTVLTRTARPGPDWAPGYGAGIVDAPAVLHAELPELTHDSMTDAAPPLTWRSPKHVQDELTAMRFRYRRLAQLVPAGVVA